MIWMYCLLPTESRLRPYLTECEPSSPNPFWISPVINTKFDNNTHVRVLTITEHDTSESRQSRLQCVTGSSPGYQEGSSSAAHGTVRRSPGLGHNPYRPELKFACVMLHVAYGDSYSSITCDFRFSSKTMSKFFLEVCKTSLMNTLQR